MKRDFSPSRRAWNIALTAAVWAAAVLVIGTGIGVGCIAAVQKKYNGGMF